jgi:hypothetical protein
MSEVNWWAYWQAKERAAKAQEEPMSRRTSLSLISVLLVVLVLALCVGAAQAAPIEREYAGPWVATCAVFEDGHACALTRTPLMPAGSCDSTGTCNSGPGELVCGKGNVDTSSTKQQTAVDGGKSCTGKCKDGRIWAASCASPGPNRPMTIDLNTICDEPDPAGLWDALCQRQKPAPMGEK